MQTREEYIEKMQQQLDEWNRELDTLEGRVTTATRPAREKLRDQLDKIRHTHDTGKAKLEEIQEAGQEGWDELKGDVNDIWEALRHSINYFRSQL